MKRKANIGNLDNTLTCQSCPHAEVTPGFKNYKGEEILRHCKYREYSFIYNTNAICWRHPGAQSMDNDTSNQH